MNHKLLFMRTIYIFSLTETLHGCLLAAIPRASAQKHSRNTTE